MRVFVTGGAGFIEAVAQLTGLTSIRTTPSRRRELTVDVVPDHLVAEDAEDAEDASVQELARCLLPMVDRLPAEQAEAIRMWTSPACRRPMPQPRFTCPIPE